MPRIDRLPPPPAVPTRSPPVFVPGEIEERIQGHASPPSAVQDRAPSLEARVHVPPGAVRAVVLCHPHPLYGGSMHSPVPLAIAKTLSEKASERLAWVRFNFRGVGASEGAYDDGQGEEDDLRAVLEHVRRAVPGAPITLCGHSFGSWVALRAVSSEGTGGGGRGGGHGAAPGPARPTPAAQSGAEGVDRIVLIAPSTRFFGFGEDASVFAGYKAIFIGSRDELCDVDEARALADKLGAELRVFEGADHHFMNSRRALAEAALPVLAPEA